MSFHRNDISIHVMQDGACYICQGNPAREKLNGLNPNNFEVCSEHDLYYSQIKYRCVIRLLDNTIKISTPQYDPLELRNRVNLYPIKIKAGFPIYIGTI